MRFWVRVLRGLTLAGFVLAGGFVGLCAASLATASHAVAQSASSIVVEGNRRVESDTIRSYFNLRPGERLDAVKVDEGVKALFATGLFQDVRPTFAGNRLIITVVENAVVSRVQFEGNKRVKDEQLLQEIQSKPRGALSRPTVQSDVQRIVEVYRRNGRYDVTVTPKIIDRPNNRVDLVFEIAEGGKTTVQDIIFIGNRSYSDWRLKDVIRTGKSNILSFLKTNNLYDPDRVESDRDLLRRWYLKNGYADVQIVSAVAEYDPSRQGFILTFTIEEGDRYNFGAIDVQSNVRDVDLGLLRSRLRGVSPGATYNAEAVEKSVEDMTIEMSKRGYAFAQVRPRGDRNYQTHTISIVFVVEEGARGYIERINVRGNTRTRDYVIRREFDIAEGDAYNRVLVDRAERRLKNLGYFKQVKITTEPGSASDRVILNVDVEEQSTGEFSIAGGYSTADGLVGEVSVGERNLLGRGQFARAAVTYGQRTRGIDLSFTEPYFLDYRLAFGIDLFAKEIDSSSYYVYRQETIGGGLRFGIPLREDLGLQLRYSAYRQVIELDEILRNCNNINPNFGLIPGAMATYPTLGPNGLPVIAAPPGHTGLTNCYSDGEASAAIKQQVEAGPAIVSLIGYGLVYNTLDNNKSPTRGFLAEVRQDVAGLGGDVNFIRTTGDARLYYEIMSDIVSVLRVQGGHIAGWGTKDLRMLDHFQMGPNLVRGFQTAGIGPRDLTLGTSQDALGGTMYWGASLEVQVPVFGVPKDFGIRLAGFVDAGSVWGYRGPTFFPNSGQTVTTIDPFTGANTNDMLVRSSIGAGIIWDSPFGPIRVDYAIPLTKDPNDRVQELRFSGGTKF